jgi:hypothetical protein
MAGYNTRAMVALEELKTYLENEHNHYCDECGSESLKAGEYFCKLERIKDVIDIVRNCY